MTLQLAVHIVIIQLPQIIGEPLVPDCQQTEEGGLASPLTAYQTCLLYTSDGRLWQSIRTMVSQVLIWSVLIYREC